MGTITAKELARLLHLSESAVSLALNNKPGVSRETRKRVVEEARTRGYDFSRKATATDKKKGTICFAVYRKSGAVVGDTPFFSELTDGISVSCRREGYECMIRYLYEDEDLREQIYDLRVAHFAGAIVLATEMDEQTLTLFDRVEIPVVFLDAYFERPEYNFVLINNSQGAYLATKYLIRKCRTQPGYLRSAYWISNFDARADGFYKAIREAGMSTSNSPVFRLAPSQDGAYADLRDLLNAGEKPAKCYFADNDLIAIGAMQALKEAGYRIPEDVSVVGFDDISSSEYVSPPLTTIQVPKTTLGETAVVRVAQMIEGKNRYPLKIEVSTRLIRRKSVTGS
ncbi:MAG: LacI family DNA-binding transcriptional regulator [Clostridia bacterium]|nr:LacI family DNA-binding transcriptional regulator [Clostridia bacterium]